MQQIRLRFIVCILFLINISNVDAQWLSVPTNISFEIKDIDFLDENNGILASDSGLYLTQNGGLIWTKVNSFNSINDSIIYKRTKFTSVYYYSFNSKYYGGGRDTINNSAVVFLFDLSTNKLELAFSDLTSTCVNAIDYSTIVGNNGLIAHLSGNNINKRTHNYTCDFYDVIKTSSDYVNICGQNIVLDVNLLNTQSSGEIVIGSGFTAKGISKTSFGDGAYIATNYNFVKLHSIYGYWSDITAYDGPLNSNGIGEVDESTYYSTCFIATDHGIYRSYDNGAVFEFIPSSNNYNINCFAKFGAIGSGYCYAAGKNGVILKTYNRGGICRPYVGFEMPNGLCKNAPSLLVNKGQNGNTYKWKIDGLQVATTKNYTVTFNSIGNHTIRLVATNSTYTDSITKTVYISALPLITSIHSVLNPLLCKSGIATIQINVSQDSVIYSLIRLPDNFIVAQTLGNGGSISLNTGVISDSTKYRIYAKNIYSDCGIFFSDTLTAGVEKTKSKFYVSNTNAYPNETIRFYNKSKYCSNVEWDFYNGSNLQHSISDSTVDVKYTTTGNKTFRQIVTSIHGCIDTSYSNSLSIYSPDSNYHRQWALNLNTSTQLNNINILANDEKDNIYYGGIYNNAELMSKSGNSISSNLTGVELFFAKYDSNGIVKWRISSKNGGANASLSSIVTTKNGNIYISGKATSIASYLISNNGDEIQLNPYNGFIVKLDTFGSIKWIAFTPNECKLSTDGFGYVYLGGKFSGVGIWKSVSGNAITKNSSNNYSHFIGKLNSNGEFQWINLINCDYNSDYYFNDIATDYNGNSYVLGTERGNQMTFLSTIGIPYLVNKPANSGQNVYIAKYNTSGVCQWGLINFENTDHDYATSITCDSIGNTYITGYLDLYNTTIRAKFNSVSKPTDSVAIINYFLCSYDTYGNFKWAVGQKGPGTWYAGAKGYDVNTDNYGNVYVSGKLYNSSSGLSNNPIIEFSSTNSNNYFFQFQNPIDLPFILKYDSLGNFKWFSTESGKNSKNLGYSNVGINEIEIDSRQDIYFTGMSQCYYPNSPYETIICNDTLHSNGSNNFIAKMDKDGVNIPDIILNPDSIYCTNNTFEIPFTVFKDYNLFSGNIFKMEISDKYGMFLNPVVIGTKFSINKQDSITCTIPANFVNSSQYRIRLYSSNQHVLSDQYIITVKNLPKSDKLDSTICKGISLTLDASDGDFYQWSPGNLFSDSTKKTVTFTPQNSIILTAKSKNYCGVGTDTFIIILKQSPVNLFPKDTSVCVFDTLILNTNPSLLYYWFPLSNISIISPSIVSISPNQSISYHITSMDSTGECYRTDTLIIIAQQLPNVQIQFDGNMLYIPNTSSYYQWYRNDSILLGETSSFIIPIIRNANYKVKAISQFGCDATSNDYFITGIDGTYYQNKLTVEIYPNPTKEFLNIEMDSKILTPLRIDMYNSLGFLLLSIDPEIPLGNKKIILDLKKLNLSTGVYYLKLQSRNDIFTFKVIFE